MARSKTFDRNDVLDRAMEVFWRKGFEGASMAELLTAMGLGRGSVYDTFGDKRGLFMAVVERYIDQCTAETIAPLIDPAASREVLVACFLQAAEQSAQDCNHKGCLMVNAAIEQAPHDRELASLLQGGFRRVEDAYYQALVRARDCGEINPHRDLRAIAQSLVCVLQGLRVTARLNPDPLTLRHIAQTTLTILD